MNSIIFSFQSLRSLLLMKGETQMSRLISLLSASTFVCLATSAPAFAQISLSNGMTVRLAGISGNTPSLRGNTIASKETPLTFTNSYVDGVFDQLIVREAATGTLDFYYRVIPQLDSTYPGRNLPLAYVELAVPFGTNELGFRHFSTSVEFIADSPGDLAPTTAKRDLNYSSFGDYIEFFFPSFPNNYQSGDIGKSSYTLLVQTNATQFSDNVMTDLPFFNINNQGYGGTEIASFGPTSVPEPSVLVLLATSGLAGANFLWRRLVCKVA